VGQLYLPPPFDVNWLDDVDVPQVAATVRELDADVVLLQELRDAVQLRAIAARAGGYVGALAEQCGYDRHTAVLVRAALGGRFEQHRLSPTERGAVLARFTVAGVRTAALTVHLDLSDAARRRQQAEAVASIAHAQTEELLVVGGDMNYDPDLGDAIDAGSYALLTRELTDVGRAAGPTMMGMMRLDHVLCRGGCGAVVRVAAARRLPTGDHAPVVCDVDLR
jgi:endonuclease/exonuclease/phosphatase family metal-dependent hydrolase